jgi:RNA polymerase sigma factor (sigma-70 family)
MTRPSLEARFQSLLEEHKRILYSICNSYCRNREDREDLAQEIVIQLWRSFGAFDGRCRFSTWMYRIALNVAISYCRRESARARHQVSADERLLVEIEETTPESEEMQFLYRFIAELDPLNKGLVLLYLDGNSYREIAQVLGISETNVATRISRLKQTMREAFRSTEPA